MEETKTILEEIQEIRTTIKEMQLSIREIQLTLENETNRNIRIIAEGHLDLSRKLDETA